jgi:hypothetical protein
LMDAGELPHDDYRGKDLDERVQSKASQGYRPCRKSSQHNDHDSDDIPAEREIFEEQASFDKSSSIQNISPVS